MTRVTGWRCSQRRSEESYEAQYEKQQVSLYEWLLRAEKRLGCSFVVGKKWHNNNFGHSPDRAQIKCIRTGKTVNLYYTGTGWRRA